MYTVLIHWYTSELKTKMPNLIELGAQKLSGKNQN